MIIEDEKDVEIIENKEIQTKEPIKDTKFEPMPENETITKKSYVLE